METLPVTTNDAAAAVCWRVFWVLVVVSAMVAEAACPVDTHVVTEQTTLQISDCPNVPEVFVAASNTRLLIMRSTVLAPITIQIPALLINVSIWVTSCTIRSTLLVQATPGSMDGVSIVYEDCDIICQGLPQNNGAINVVSAITVRNMYVALHRSQVELYNSNIHALNAGMSLAAVRTSDSIFNITMMLTDCDVLLVHPAKALTTNYGVFDVFYSTSGDTFSIIIVGCTLSVLSASAFLMPNDFLWDSSAATLGVSTDASCVVLHSQQYSPPADHVSIVIENSQVRMNGSTACRLVWLDDEVQSSSVEITNVTVHSRIAGLVDEATSWRFCVLIDGSTMISSSVQVRQVHMHCAMVPGLQNKTALASLDEVRSTMLRTTDLFNLNVVMKDTTLLVTSLTDDASITTFVSYVVANFLFFQASNSMAGQPGLNASLTNCSLTSTIPTMCPAARTALVNRAAKVFLKRTGGLAMATFSTNAMRTLASSSMVLIQCSLDNPVIHVVQSTVQATMPSASSCSLSYFPVSYQIMYCTSMVQVLGGMFVRDMMRGAEFIPVVSYLLGQLLQQPKFSLTASISSSLVTASGSTVELLLTDGQASLLGNFTTLVLLYSTSIGNASSIEVKRRNSDGTAMCVTHYSLSVVDSYVSSSIMKVTGSPSQTCTQRPGVQSHNTTFTASTVMIADDTLRWRTGTASSTPPAQAVLMLVTRTLITEHSTLVFDSVSLTGFQRLLPTSPMNPSTESYVTLDATSHVRVTCVQWNGAWIGRSAVGGWVVLRQQLQLVAGNVDGSCVGPLSLSATRTVTDTVPLTASRGLPLVVPPPVLSRPQSQTLLVASVLSAVTQLPIGALALGRMYGTLRMLRCDGDAPLMQELDFTVNPLQLRIGADYGASQRGGLVGNVVVLYVGCTLLVCCVAGVRWWWRADRALVSWADVMESHAMPGWAATYVLPLVQPTMTCAVQLLAAHVAYEGGAAWSAGWVTPILSPADVGGASVAIVFLMVLYLCVAWVLRPSYVRELVVGVVGRQAWYHMGCGWLAWMRAPLTIPESDDATGRWGVVGEVKAGVEQARRVMMARGRLLLVFVCRSLSVWRPVGRRRDLSMSLLRRFGELFRPFHPDRYWWLLADCGVSLVMAVLGGLLPQTQSACDAVLRVSAAVSIALALAVLWSSPVMARRLDNTLYVSQCVCGAVLAVVACTEVDPGVLIALSLTVAAFSMLSGALSLLSVLLETLLGQRGGGYHDADKLDVVPLRAVNIRTLTKGTPLQNLELLLRVICEEVTA